MEVKTEATDKTVNDTDIPAKQSRISGSCACGSLTWSSTTLPPRGSFCHCTTCRKISGAAFLGFLSFPSSSITFSPPLSSSASTVKIVQMSKNAERGFCSACGSALTMRYFVTPETWHVTIGSVDEGTTEEGELDEVDKKHLYLKEKVEWYHVPEDGWPRFDTMPNEDKYLGFGN